MNQTGTIGIIGGGQLGRMLTEAALPLGFKVIVLNPAPDSPAAQVGAEEIIGDLYDPKALKELSDRADYVTVEIEHLDAALLAEVASAGKPVNPAPQTIQLIQDKYAQKVFLRDSHIPVADFTEINDEKTALQALEHFGGKIVIKTKRDAFDGRGNFVASSPDEVKQALLAFKGKPLYAERFLPFQKELAVMVVRDNDGNIYNYPVVETIQRNNICVEVLAPAQISEEFTVKAVAAARDVVRRLKGSGVFGVELFLTNDGRIVVNEIAPRVHNSGHYTIEACKTSQFEQHIRAITGLPLGSCDLQVPAAVMVNILGDRDGETNPQGIDKATSYPHTYVHLYGKSPTKIDRKMGHLTVTANSVEQAKDTAEKARTAISI